jgi:hypothetical protein
MLAPAAGHNLLPPPFHKKSLYIHFIADLSSSMENVTYGTDEEFEMVECAGNDDKKADVC